MTIILVVVFSFLFLTVDPYSVHPFSRLHATAESTLGHDLFKVQVYKFIVKSSSRGSPSLVLVHGVVEDGQVGSCDLHISTFIIFVWS